MSEPTKVRKFRQDSDTAQAKKNNEEEQRRRLKKNKEDAKNFAEYENLRTFALPKRELRPALSRGKYGNQLKINKMKKGLHPETYRLVAFKDMSNDQVFITRSCANTRETIEIEGVEYPVVKVEISNTSHPFYTGKMKLVDTAGRVDKFYQRYANKKK